MKKRFLIAAIAAAAVFATVLGVAASITVNSDNLGAGGDEVASCDGSVGTSYVLKYVNDTGFVVDKVVVTGISEACNGQQLTVVLTKDGDQLALETVPLSGLSGPSTNVTVEFDPTEPKAEDVDDVHVAIAPAAP